MCIQYQVAPGVLWRWLDDEVVVYLCACCETHLLDARGGELLDLVQACQLAGQPCHAQALADTLLRDEPQHEVSTPGGAGSSTDPSSDPCANAPADPAEHALALSSLALMLDEFCRRGLLVGQAC